MSRRRHVLPGRPALLVLLGLTLLTASCAKAPRALGTVTPSTAAAPFSFAADTFAFANMIRARYAGHGDLYANYCFVLARAIRQFHVAARFDPDAPKLETADYIRRVREVATYPPWAEPAPATERVVIPGYRNLREFSRGEEWAIKQALDARLWTLLHWTNWRVTHRVSAEHQETVAREIVDDLAAGRLVQLLVTNWPKPELNHTVVAFAFRDAPGGVELSVWDPNDPDTPGIVTFERAARRFFATRVHDTEPGPIRAFRMYYSWFL